MKKKFVCVCMHKMANINKEKYENNNIETMIDGIVKLQHIQEKLGHKNLPVITNKYDKVYKK